MKGLKLFLFVSFIVALISGLAYLLLPSQMADAKMGPQDAPSARYFGVTFIGLSGAAWYGFRNPKKNVAVVRAIITIWLLSALVGLYNGVTGAEAWGSAIGSIIGGTLLGGGLVIFYPRGEKAT